MLPAAGRDVKQRRCRKPEVRSGKSTCNISFITGYVCYQPAYQITF